MSTPSHLAETDNGPPWRPWWRWIISGVLAFHVTAVFMGPFAFSTRTENGTSSALADWLMPVFQAYEQAAYLDHGYAFFAPDPGPSHLVRFKVDYEDDREPVEGTFPNLKDEWPRLLYHRHFMLSEQLHSAFVPASIESGPPNIEPPHLDLLQQAEWKQDVARLREEREASWRHDRQAYEARWSSYERHLKHVFGGDSVSLVRIEHRQPNPFLVRKLKLRLDDESLYRPLTKDDTGAPR